MPEVWSDGRNDYVICLDDSSCPTWCIFQGKNLAIIDTSILDGIDINVLDFRELEILVYDPFVYLSDFFQFAYSPIFWNHPYFSIFQLWSLSHYSPPNSVN